MADYRAILAVSEAMRGLLLDSYQRGEFDSLQTLPSGESHDDVDRTPLQFEIYTTGDFRSHPVANGVTIFLYRIYINGVNRIPMGNLPGGSRKRPQLPLELHYLVTIWAGQHTLQHSLAAWTMRTLEDNALVHAGTLNAGGRGIFRPEETVELSLAEMRTEDLFRIWEVLGTNPYHLSIPYLARVVPIESIERKPEVEGPLVQERLFRNGRIQGGEDAQL